MEFWLWFVELLSVVAVVLVALTWLMDRHERRRAAREREARERGALADRLRRAERQPRDHPFERSTARRGNGSL